MKRNVFKPLLMIFFSMMCFLNLSGQNTWGNDSVVNPFYYDYAQILPHNPGPTDSVYLEYTYVSNDACPDFYLKLDSVIKNSVYALKHEIPAQGRVCAEVVTKFKTTLFLGVFSESTEVYLDGKLISTFNPYDCNMDMMGKVISLTEKSSIIQEENSFDIYEIRDVLLKEGTLVKFHGTKIQCFTTPCYNIVDCYAIVDVADCVMDKKGVVVAGKDACEGQLFVQEFSPEGDKTMLYLINTPDSIYNDSIYENGIVKGGAVRAYLNEGDVVYFSGYMLENEKDSTVTCAYDGIVTCFELIDTNQCIMDKIGVVVAGEGDCANRLFVQEETNDNTQKALYGIEEGNYEEIPLNGMPYIGLKIGDKIQFGAGPLKNEDGNVSDMCKISGVVTCYEIIIPYQECIIDKKGVVVQGKNMCEGQLFIKELTASYSTPKLYIFIPDGIINENGMFISRLKEGDKVAFGSIPFDLDSIFAGLSDSAYFPPVVDCAIAGFATCYELTEAAETFTLSGKAVAGNELVQAGSAVLFANGFRKALNAVSLNSDGTFTFNDLIPGEYTVRVIPDFKLYKNLLPTFYTNKLRFKRADYISLKSSVDSIKIELRTHNRQVGNGKIYGNIFYESTGLKDTVLTENGSTYNKSGFDQNFANNLPVILLSSKNQPVDWTLTDEYGNYKFEDLAIDSYIVVSETAGAEAEFPVDLTIDNAVVNADLVLKNFDANTDVLTPATNIINMYPNPIIDNLTISLLENDIVKIYNATGQLCVQYQVYEGDNVLDLSHLNKGMYFIQIGNDKSKILKK